MKYSVHLSVFLWGVSLWLLGSQQASSQLLTVPLNGMNANSQESRVASPTAQNRCFKTEQSSRMHPIAMWSSPGNNGQVTESGEKNAAPFVEGFENLIAMEIDQLTTEMGEWRRSKGVCRIDAGHAKTGRNCLQLAGGEESEVILKLADEVDTSGELTFWAERWTSRTPFRFRIDKKSRGEWSEIFNGDESVRVGRAFRSNLRIHLGDEGIEQLRFRVVSPPDTGILIDDLKISPAVPQKVVSVEAIPLTRPVLLGKQANPIALFKVVTVGNQDPVELSQLSVELKCFSEDVEAVQAYFGTNPESIADAERIGQAVNLEGANVPSYEVVQHTLHPKKTLLEGDNFIWIGCALKPDAELDHGLTIRLREVVFSDGEKRQFDAPAFSQRYGIALRQAGEDGVHTFRIPGLATTRKGTLIAVYDIRHRSGRDLPGDIDVGMSRSTDQGRKWEPMRVIMDMGSGAEWQYDGVGDPAVLVDRQTGTIWVAALWSHGNRGWHGSGPGVKPEETGQLMLVKSDDDGQTWSKPLNITKQVKRPEWSLMLQGPGKGISMRDGTLVFAAQYQDSPDRERLPHSTLLYSKDHGKHWHAGSSAWEDTTEAQLVELEPGRLMLNCRYNRKSARVVMTTDDLGETWQRHPTSEGALIEPRACMASIIDVNRELNRDDPGWYLFSNPDDSERRRRITIKASSDLGQTWPQDHQILLDDGVSAGYSCMSMVDENTVGILYESSGAQLVFQRVPLSEITD